MLDSNLTGTFSVGYETMTWTAKGSSDTGPAGTLVKVQDWPVGGVHKFWLVFGSGQRRPQYGDTLTGDVSGASFDTADIGVGTLETEVLTFPEYYTTHAAYISGLADLADRGRDEVQSVPGGGTIVGLHHHEDQLYAIRDVTQITVPSGDEGVLVPGMYVRSPTNQIGEVMTVDASTRTVTIAPTSAAGFALTASDNIDICLSIRFNTGTGGFTAADDVLFATSGWAGDVGLIDIRDGNFESDNALGVAVFVSPTVTAPVIVAEVINNVTATGSMVVESLMFPDEASATSAEAVSTQSEIASMWRSTDAGWEAATTGRQLAFYNGTQDPSGTTANSATMLPTAVAYHSSGSVANAWSAPYSDVLTENAVTSFSNPYVSSAGAIRASDWLQVTDFKFGLLDSDTVTGMEVNFKGNNATVASGTGNFYDVQLLEGGEFYATPVPHPALAWADPAGGDGLSWGVELTPSKVNSSDFGFRFRARNTVAFPAGAAVEVDVVSVEIFYTSPSTEKLYIWSGGTVSLDPGEDVGYIRVDSANLLNGTWVGGDAEGYFRITDWSAVSIPAGSHLYTLPGGPDGGGVLIADISGAITLPTLPGSLLLDENVSKYQMISYNFFASEEQNAIYGVTGAGRAFWYDGAVLDFISTGLDQDKDKPRHVAPHENRLALGYQWGELYLSGTDPLNFDTSVELAASFGFGDKITGLMPAPGKALAVFTESSTNVLVGAPESFGVDALANVEQRVINHKVGAIEYTVQNMGTTPIFASFRGIETLETMDQYSDFFTAPLTYDVSPWLLERLQTAAGVEAVNKAVVNSVVVRNKNQYRLFFADGYVMTLTFVGPEKEPQCTIQQYWFEGSRDKFLRCFATASGVTTDGRDRAFISAEERLSGLSFDPGYGLATSFVYELDKGRSFDGGPIDAYFDLTHYFSQAQQGGPSPERAHRFNSFHFHGTAAGTADLHVSRAMNYEDFDDPIQGYEPMPFYDGALPSEDTAKPKYGKGRLNGRGFAVSLRVSHTSLLEFPHTIQMVTFLNDVELKQDY